MADVANRKRLRGIQGGKHRRCVVGRTVVNDDNLEVTPVHGRCDLVDQQRQVSRLIAAWYDDGDQGVRHGNQIDRTASRMSSDAVGPTRPWNGGASTGTRGFPYASGQIVASVRDTPIPFTDA